MADLVAKTFSQNSSCQNVISTFITVKQKVQVKLPIKKPGKLQ